MTDRQITLISLIVAVIGAAAAVAVVPEFRCWVLHVDCPSSETPASAASMPTITLSVDHSGTPFQAYQLHTLPAVLEPQFPANAPRPVGYFLWPELDLDDVLFSIRAGSETGENTFIDRQSFIDGSENHKKQRIWAIFVGIGHVLKHFIAAKGQLYAQILTKYPEVIKILSTLPPNDDADAGFAYLRAIYFPRQKSLSDKLVQSVDLIMPLGAEIVLGEGERVNEAARLLATARIYPLLDMVIANKTANPIILTSITLDVIAVVPAFSALDSGPLSSFDTIRFDLDGKPETIVRSLPRPIKIAPKDAVAVRLEFRSTHLFSYLCRVDVYAGDSIQVSSQKFLIDFGFQPPADASPM